VVAAAQYEELSTHSAFEEGVRPSSMPGMNAAG